MDRIDKYNVEAWLLDYHEGNLDKGQTDQLNAFLADHPDLGLDIDFSDFLLLESEQLEFPMKDELFQSEFSIPDISDDEVECIAAMEGDLNAEESARFHESLGIKPGKAILFEQIKKTSLKPGAVIFPEKSRLYRKGILIPAWAYSSVAAAAILIIAVMILGPRQVMKPDTGLANQNEREVIFMNKLAHPSEYDLIASSFSVKTPDTRIREIPAIDTEPILSRDDTRMTSISRMAGSQILVSNEFRPSSREAFITRQQIDRHSPEEYQTLLAFTGDLIRTNILAQDPELVKKSRFSLWELADAGLDVFARRFSLPIDIERQYNQEGKLVEVSFDSRLVAFTTPVNPQRGQ